MLLIAPRRRPPAGRCPVFEFATGISPAWGRRVRTRDLKHDPLHRAAEGHAQRLATPRPQRLSASHGSRFKDQKGRTNKARLATLLIQLQTVQRRSLEDLP